MSARLRIGACLSLSGKFARFGRQAAAGLKAWQSLDASADLMVEDDQSDRRTLESVLPGVARRCDILLGPYSTILMRAAERVATDSEWLIWNHGGSGDDVEQSHPGYVVSVLTPTSRYAVPFVRYLAGTDDHPRDLCIINGPGRFGRQVADGAAAAAASSGIHSVRAELESFPPPGMSREWDLFSAGVFEHDAEVAAKALHLPDPPSRVCVVAAGIRDFAQAVENPDGVFGIAQWFSGAEHEVQVGPEENKFLRAYAATEATGQPDYPAVQAAAGAILALHCAKLAGSIRRKDLWDTARQLNTSTLFGGFRIASDGSQDKHETVLVRWADGELRSYASTFWQRNSSG